MENIHRYKVVDVQYVGREYWYWMVKVNTQGETERERDNDAISLPSM